MKYDGCPGVAAVGDGHGPVLWTRNRFDGGAYPDRAVQPPLSR